MHNSYTIITGATSGIGKACAEKLAAEKKNLILLARRKEKLQSLQREFTAHHEIDVLIFAIDVTDIAQVDQFYKEIEDKEVGTLINNAGLARGKDALENYEWGDIEQMLDTNIKGFIRVAQLAIPFLKKTKGHIVNISSIAGMEAYEGGAVYCGTKAFVRMISRSLRIDVLGTGIRVTDIAPGAVDTEFSTVRFKGDTAKAKKVYEGFVPLHAEDIADCICFVLNRPPHVNVAEMLILPTAQASIARIARDLQ
jgi:NADP-dependent 3-hydroxy acid dehydrogenase YdfG